MAKKKKPIRTPLQTKILEICDQEGKVTLSEIQRRLQVSFVKACELAKLLHDSGQIQSNINELMIYKE